MEFATARRGVVVVAHPDDESLWCGGLLVRYPIDWTIVACSIPKKDPIRAWKFFDACVALGAKGRLLPFSERDFTHLATLDLSAFDLIVTHGAAGEYGNPQHKEVHAYVKERWADRARYFGWRDGGRGTEVVELDENERARKLAALKCYDHIAPSHRLPVWEELIETFGKAFDIWRETYD